MSEIFKSNPKALGIFLVFSGIAAWIILIVVILVITFIVPKFDYYRVQAIGTIFAAFGAVGALAIVGYQSLKLKASVKLQTETFYLENRPYVYVRFKPQFNYSDITPYGGGNFVFENTGKIPATVVELTAKAYSDVRGEIGIYEWWDKAFGSHVEVKTVFPRQEEPIYFKGCMGDAKFFYVELLVTYTGIQEGRKYWSQLAETYNVVCDSNNKRIPAVHIETKANWDRNSKFVPARPQAPDWEKYRDYLGKKKTHKGDGTQATKM